MSSHQTLEQNQAYTDEEMREFEEHLVQQEEDLNQKTVDLQKQREELERQQEQLNSQKIELQQVRSGTSNWNICRYIYSSVKVSPEEDIQFVNIKVSITLYFHSAVYSPDNFVWNSLQAVEHMEKLKTQNVEPPPDVHGEFRSHN